MTCQHLHTETTEDERVITTESGPEFEIESHTLCLDCGAELEPPALDWLTIDREPTRFEIELLTF